MVKIVVTLRNFYDASFIIEKIRLLHKARNKNITAAIIDYW